MTEETTSPITDNNGDARSLCKRTWWTFLIGGIASVLFGIMAFANPGAALFVLATFFAAFVLVDGASNIWGALSNREKDGWWAILLFGILGVLVGGYALINPPVSMAVFVYLVAFLAMFNGAMLIALGWRIRKATTREWMLYTTGVLSMIFGVLILSMPVAGSLTVVYVIASWAIATGILRVIFAFKAKNLRDDVVEKVQAAADS